MAKATAARSPRKRSKTAKSTRCPTHKHKVAGVPEGVDLQKEHRQQCLQCPKLVRYCQRCDGWSSTSRENWYKHHTIDRCSKDRKADVSTKRKKAAAAQNRDLRKTGKFAVNAPGVLLPGARRQMRVPPRVQQFLKTCSSKGVLEVANLGAVPQDSDALQEFNKDITKRLERGTPVSFRVEALSEAGRDLLHMKTFLTSNAVHSIQHLRVMDNKEQGCEHPEDQSVPAGDEQERAQCRILHK
ncbi:hypothetical protein JKP88DRAFT_243841 [Tribonema minus]|uniref:Uncharacterized protein n=1 Tax=Tribonema minus TaxID=303371 RepID=A0A835Z7Z0_9STRA|nr:hypothetical protein JKP88DRAFT_243841 [Tribonema minus]